jgi:hypothetical protein
VFQKHATKATTLTCRDPQVFWNRSNFKILCSRRVTCSRFQTEDPQILGATVQTVDAFGTCCPRFAYPLVRSMSERVLQPMFVLFIIEIRSKVISLPKLHTAEAQMAAGGNLHLVVLDETENYEGRIAFRSMTIARCSTKYFLKLTMVEQTHTLDNGRYCSILVTEKNTVNVPLTLAPNPPPHPVCQRSSVWGGGGLLAVISYWPNVDFRQH